MKGTPRGLLLVWSARALSFVAPGFVFAFLVIALSGYFEFRTILNIAGVAFVLACAVWAWWITGKTSKTKFGRATAFFLLLLLIYTVNMVATILVAQRLVEIIETSRQELGSGMERALPIGEME
ncbi:MAG: hypothetical protein AAGD00_00380 [Planctomycetota bacterium]